MKGLQGKREDATSIESEQLALNFTHVEVTFKDVISSKKRDGVVSFQRPFHYHFRTLRDKGEMKPNLTVLITPVRSGCSRVFISRIGPKFVPAWLSHGGSNRFLNTDTWLHDSERFARRKSSTSLQYVSASKSDVGPALFRKV